MNIYLFQKLLFKKGNFLRKIKEVSLALVVTPILFSGCMQEKVSTIIPAKSTDKEIVLDLGEKSQTTTLESDIKIKGEVYPLAKTYPLESIKESNTTSFALADESTLLNDLINNTEESSTTDDNIQELTHQALGINGDWVEETKEDKIIETAEEFLGVKYVWAANGPSAFDCSGFTKYVFKKNGISLPRYSGHQANIGTKVSFSELKKGDLVFFDTAKEFKHIVNHVGIYIGHNKFIHASSGGKKVMITSFSKKKFYRHKFLYARRVINSNSNVAINTIK